MDGKGHIEVRGFWRNWLVQQFLGIQRLLRRPAPSIDFQAAFSTVKRILIVLPQDQQLCVDAAGMPAKLRHLFPSARCDFALPDQCKELVPKNEYWGYTEDELTFLHLPNLRFIKKVQDMHYDLVISPSADLDLFTAYLSLKSNAKLRVTFQSPQADQYFNMMIQPNPETDTSGKIDTLLKYLHLMQPIEQPSY
jgi:hypothetical protein